MDVYLDRLDQKRAWLIIAWGGTPRDNVIGWRVDGFQSNDHRCKTLAVFPVVPEAPSEILGVLRVDLDVIHTISIREVRQVGMPLTGALPFDFELVSVAPEPPDDASAKWSVWDVDLQDTPVLHLSQVTGRPNLAQSHNAFVQLMNGNQVFPGVPIDSVEVAPRIDVTREPLSGPDYDDLLVGAYKLTLKAHPEEIESPIEISTEHLLAGCDVVNVIESENSKTSILKNFGDPILLTAENAKEGIEIALVRETEDGELLSVGFLDRVALKADKDCTFEFWRGDQQVFTAGNGLLVLAHVGDGELVQDTGFIRTTLLDEVEEKYKNREKPLFLTIGPQYFKLPRSSNEKFSLPLQFACFDLCRTMSELDGYTADLPPFSMDIFAAQPEIFFAVTTRLLREVAVYEYGELNDRKGVRAAIKQLCLLALTEAVETGFPDIDLADVEAWCEVIEVEAAWNLFELVLSGAALEMIRLGVAFDGKEPTRFAAYYAKRGADLRRLDHSAKQPTPILLSTGGSKFVPVGEAIRALKSLDSDWSKIAKIATDVARNAGLFLTYPSFEARSRHGLSPDEYDTRPVFSTLRELIEDAIQDDVLVALAKHDKSGRFDSSLVTQVIASWFIEDHDRDLKTALRIIEVAESNKPSGIDPFKELMNAFYAARNPSHKKPDVDLSSMDQNALDKSLRNSTSVLGRDVIATLIEASSNKLNQVEDRTQVSPV